MLLVDKLMFYVYTVSTVMYERLRTADHYILTVIVVCWVYVELSEN